MLLKTEITGEIFTHNTLWTMASRHINYALTNERGSFYDYLSAMLFSFLTFEAYLNFVGEKLRPEFWANERKNFRHGVLEKARLIFEVCELPALSEADEAYATIVRLKALRDKLAHGKTVKLHEEVVHTEDAPPEFTGHDPLHVEVNKEAALTALRHTEELIRRVHEAAENRVKDPWFRSARLGLNNGYRSHSTGILS